MEPGIAKAVLSAVASAMVVVDYEGRIIHSNRHANELLGIAEPGMEYTGLFRLAEGVDPAGEVARTGEPLEHIQLSGERMGHPATWGMTLSPIDLDTGGRDVLILFRDITNEWRKRMNDIEISSALADLFLIPPGGEADRLPLILDKFLVSDLIVLAEPLPEEEAFSFESIRSFLPPLNQTRISSRMTLAGMAHGTRNPIIVPDLAARSESDAILLSRAGLSSVLIHPLVHRGAVAGLLVIASRRPGAYGASEADIIERLNDPIAAAFSERNQIKRIERIAAAAQRQAAVGKIAAAVAHEVNNPLAAIRAHLSLIRQESGADVSVIEEQVERIGAVMKSLLHLANPRPRRNATSRPGEVIQRVADLMNPVLEESRIRLAISPGPEMTVPLHADEFQQVLINLIENSRHAIGCDGNIRVKVDARGGDCHVRVEDDGPGFPGDLIDPFAPFATTRSEGSGLGLSLVADIVSSVGGTIDHGNPPKESGGGAFVALTLPITNPDDISRKA